MFGDTNNIAELHEFASRLGLKKTFFQEEPRLPHYDLTEGKRKKAIKLGAIEVDRQFLYNVMRRNQK